jgi:putative oxidoreductase
MTEKAKNGILKKGYWGLVQGEKFIGHFLLLIIRLYWGGLLVITGLGKWMNIDHVADSFQALALPFPLFTAYFIGAVEFFGGLSLFFGLFTRFFSLLLTIEFLVAYGVAHKTSVEHLFTNPSEFIMQDPFLYLYAALVVLCFGPGLFSIDYWTERSKFGTSL